MSAETKQGQQPSRVSLFLVVYRWASLLPGIWPILSVQTTPSPGIDPRIALGAALGTTLLVTLFSRSLNHLLVRYPYLLAVDIVLAGGLLAFSGGTQSAYYLYALSPLLAGAFLFQMRGAVVSASFFTAIYLVGLSISQRIYASSTQPDGLITQIAGIWLIAIFFGYPSVLLKRLRKTHDELRYARDELADQNLELSSTHRQLQIIHDLTLSLQTAPDVSSVGKRVLEFITDDLGFERAVIGLVNPTSNRIENWESRPEVASLPLSQASLPLEPSSGPLAGSLLTEPVKVHLPAGQSLTGLPELNRWLGAGPWLLVPLVLRENPVGVLLVATGEAEDASMNGRLEMLEPITNQAAVALGTTMMCIDRTQRLATERERNRIARDTHDTAA